MHMESTLITAGTAAVMGTSSLTAAGRSVYHLKKQEWKESVPKIAAAGALIFGMQMLNFTIPGTGSSGHIVGGLLLAGLFGPHIAFLTLSLILGVQCLFFGDGGLMALGCNIWNMGFYSCYAGYHLFIKPAKKASGSTVSLLFASVLGSILTLQMGAFSVVLETQASGITALPFQKFAGFMQPIHLAIGLCEGLITFGILYVHAKATEQNFTIRQQIACLGSAAFGCAAVFSSLASANPDGLEWSIAKIIGTDALPAEGGIYQAVHAIQQGISFLPDYTVTGITNPFLTTALAGTTGILIVALAVFLLFRPIYNKKS